MSTHRAWSFIPLALAAMVMIWAQPAATEPAFADRARGMFPQADHVGAMVGEGRRRGTRYVFEDTGVTGGA